MVHAGHGPGGGVRGHGHVAHVRGVPDESSGTSIGRDQIGGEFAVGLPSQERAGEGVGDDGLRPRFAGGDDDAVAQQSRGALGRGVFAHEPARRGVPDFDVGRAQRGADEPSVGGAPEGADGRAARAGDEQFALARIGVDPDDVVPAHVHERTIPGGICVSALDRVGDHLAAPAERPVQVLPLPAAQRGRGGVEAGPRDGGFAAEDRRLRGADVGEVTFSLGLFGAAGGEFPLLGGLARKDDRPDEARGEGDERGHDPAHQGPVAGGEATQLIDCRGGAGGDGLFVEKPPQVHRQFRGGGVAALGFLVHRLGDDRLNVLVESPRHAAQAGWGFIHDDVGRLGQGAGPHIERRLAREQLVENDAQGVDIGARADGAEPA